jgi:hypothetical protein
MDKCKPLFLAKKTRNKHLVANLALPVFSTSFDINMDVLGCLTRSKVLFTV